MIQSERQVFASKPLPNAYVAEFGEREPLTRTGR
jgi:hypothetical protein